MSGRRPGSPRLLRLAGVSLILGSALLVVLYTALTIREAQLIEATFGRLATGAGRTAMVPQLLVVDGLGILGILVGALLLRRARRDALPDRDPAAVVLRDGRSATTVRRVRADEVDDARDVVLRAYRDLLGDDLDDEYLTVLGDVEDRAARAEVLVAVDDADVVGCVTYVPALGPYAEFDDADAAGIRMLAVDPERQRRGVGMALVEACLERAQADGRAKVVLHSTREMMTAQRLYERLGFTRIPQRDVQVRADLVLLGFERPL